MIRTVNRLADRLVGLVLPSLEAGACVPEMGLKYWRSCGSCKCVPDQRWVRKDCECRINCNGVCVNTGATRCVTTQAIC